MQPPVSFNKPALTIDQQLDLLIKRGIAIADRALAKHYLTHISYYRLRAYWLPYEASPPTNGDHEFRPGTRFDDILALYVFDRELRLLLLDAIERFEVSLRSRWANHLAMAYGPFAHDDGSHFRDLKEWANCSTELAKEYARSRETFATHYRSKYPSLSTPPVWVASELMAFGQLSKWLKNLKLPRDRQAIADTFGLDEVVLVSFAHHLAIVRNHCAHHGRVWNRQFSFRMRIPAKKPRDIGSSFNPTAEAKIYNTLTMLAFLLNVVSPPSTWETRVKKLICGNPQVNPADMGFPENWEKLPVWNGR